jgi:hypothetical protein
LFYTLSGGLILYYVNYKIFPQRLLHLVNIRIRDLDAVKAFGSVCYGLDDAKRALGFGGFSDYECHYLLYLVMNSAKV